MKTFLLQYQYEGLWYGFDILADGWGQAEAFANMSPGIKLDGEKVGESIPFDGIPFESRFTIIKDD